MRNFIARWFAFSLAGVARSLLDIGSGAADSGRDRASRRAFTLIELLAAMTILTLMVLLISRIFADSTNISRLGIKRVQSNTDGRAVVDFMVAELSAALCDGPSGPLSLRLDSNFRQAFGMDPDRMFFVTSSQTAERRSGGDYRQVSQVVYDLDEMKDSINSATMPKRYCVVRYGVEKLGGSFTCYQPGGFPKTVPAYKGWNAQTLSEDVRTLEFWVYDTNGVTYADYDSTVHGPPGWIEVYLELLGKDNAIKAALMNDADAKTYCDRNVKRYVGRAFLHANGDRT
jgi:prepilin-type N-terminal cleavage/methylation domain-containing protein